MPKVSEVFVSPFLRGSELISAQDAYVTAWCEETIYGERAYVLDLDLGGGASARLRLGTMLAHDIKAALGGEDDFDSWIGRWIKIFSAKKPIKDKVTGEEKIVDMIRAMASERDKPAKPLSGPPDDDIPF